MDKPIRVDLSLTQKQLKALNPLFKKLGGESLIMVQVYNNGDACGFWLPTKWAHKAIRLGKEIFKAATESKND